MLFMTNTKGVHLASLHLDNSFTRKYTSDKYCRINMHIYMLWCIIRNSMKVHSRINYEINCLELIYNLGDTAQKYTNTQEIIGILIDRCWHYFKHLVYHNIDEFQETLQLHMYNIYIHHHYLTLIRCKVRVFCRLKSMLSTLNKHSIRHNDILILMEFKVSKT